MKPEDENWINNASLEQLLSRWRFAPIGDSWFQDRERATLHEARMEQLRSENPSEWTAISKRLGH